MNLNPTAQCNQSQYHIPKHTGKKSTPTSTNKTSKNNSKKKNGTKNAVIKTADLAVAVAGSDIKMIENSLKMRKNLEWMVVVVRCLGKEASRLSSLGRCILGTIRLIEMMMVRVVISGGVMQVVQRLVLLRVLRI